MVALLAAVTLLAGAYPALVLARVRPVNAMRVGTLALGPRFLSTVLVGLQFTIASFLAIVVIVVYAENADLQRTGLHTQEDPLLLIANAIPLTHIQPATLRAELARISQVTGVTEIAGPPWQGIGLTTVSGSPDAAAPSRTAQGIDVGFDFFRIFGIGLLAGRTFDPAFEADEASSDTSAQETTTPRPVVVNRAMTEQFGLGGPAAAVGQLLYFPQSMMAAFGQQAVPLRIIGVVENKPLTFRNAGTMATLYQYRERLSFSVAEMRSDDLPAGLAAVDAAWRRLAPDVAISRQFVDEAFEKTYKQYRQVSQAFSALTFFALAIATVGLIGMAALVTGRRRHEIGLRKTLGASTRQMIGMLLTGFSKPVVVANVVAWPLAYIAARIYLKSFLTPIPITPLPFLACLTATLAIAWLAVGSQTLRAARSRPADVLREE